MSWTDEREKKLRELWGKGRTANQIADMLGNTTRNAVIGKAHRLKLAARAHSKNSQAKSREQKNQNQIHQIRSGFLKIIKRILLSKWVLFMLKKMS